MSQSAISIDPSLLKGRSPTNTDYTDSSTNTTNNMASPMKKPTTIGAELRLGICVAGIYFFYMFYGVLQEKIYKPNENGDVFDNTLFLLGVQCFVNMLVAVVGLAMNGWSSTTKPLKDEATQSPFSRWTSHSGTVWVAIISFTYLGAMFASNSALRYVNYPTQVLGKSCKMIPVMLANVLVGGKRYSFKEYMFVLLITIGILTFNLGKPSKEDDSASSTFGLVLLFVSLAGDGLTSSNQRLFSNEYKPSTHGLMYQMNMWSCVYLTVLLGVTGEGVRGLVYCTNNPIMLQSLLMFAVCSAMGQNFIFYTITGPGPLACTTITTTRKFFTILISILLYPENSLTSMQMGGVLFVFMGLGGELGDKFLKQRARAVSQGADGKVM